MGDSQQDLEPVDFAFIEEVRLLGYGESDTSGRWLKLEITEEVLNTIRGRKGEIIEVAARFVGNDGSRGPGHGGKPAKPPKGPHGNLVTRLMQQGFFRAPAVWRVIGTDDDYLAWVRRQRCCISEQYGRHGGDIVPMHVRRQANGAGLALKPEYSAIPGCVAHHQLQTDRGESAVGGAAHYDRQRIEHLQRWCMDSLREAFGVTSLTDVPLETWLEWAATMGVTSSLPREFRE